MTISCYNFIHSVFPVSHSFFVFLYYSSLDVHCKVNWAEKRARILYYQQEAKQSLA